MGGVEINIWWCNRRLSLGSELRGEVDEMGLGVGGSWHIGAAAVCLHPHELFATSGLMFVRALNCFNGIERSV